MAARPPIPGLQDAAYGPMMPQPNASSSGSSNHDQVASNLRGYGPRTATGSRPSSFIAGSAGSNVAAHGALLDGPSYSSSYSPAATTGSSSHAPYPNSSHNFYANYNHVKNNNYSLHHTPRFHEDFDAASQRGSVVLEGPSAVQATSASAANTSTSATPTPTPGVLQRSASQMSQSRSATPTRSSTLKKRSSLSKRGSMRRSGSRKSLRAGSVRSLNLGDREKYGAEGADDVNSAFAVPIPTDGNPTDALANRFQCTSCFSFFFINFFEDEVLTQTSMAQNPQRLDRFLQGTSKVVRNAVEVIPVGVKCHQQLILASVFPQNRRSRGCDRDPA